MPPNHIASQRDTAAAHNKAVSKGVFSPYSRITVPSPYSCITAPFLYSLFPSFTNKLRLQTFDIQGKMG